MVGRIPKQKTPIDLKRSYGHLCATNTVRLSNAIDAVLDLKENNIQNSCIEVIAYARPVGVPIQITYKNTTISSAFTMGQTPCDITGFVRLISNVPSNIDTDQEVSVFGYVTATMKTLAALFTQTERDAGLASIRHLIGDILQSPDRRPERIGQLSFVGVSNLLEDPTQSFVDHGAVVPYFRNPLSTVTRDQVEAFYNFIREDLGSSILDAKSDRIVFDGIVLTTQPLPEIFFHVPFDSDKIECCVTDVKYALSEYGALHPVVTVQAQGDAGNIKRTITYPSYGLLHEHDIHPGSIVLVRDVNRDFLVAEPTEFISMDHPIRTRKKPSVCPVCSSTLVETSRHLKCANDACPGIIRAQVRRIISPEYLNLPSEIVSRLDNLVEFGYIPTISDFLNLDRPSPTGTSLNLLYPNEMVDQFREWKSQTIQTLARSDDASLDMCDRILRSMFIPGISIYSRRSIRSYLNGMLPAYLDEVRAVDQFGTILQELLPALTDYELLINIDIPRISAVAIADNCLRRRRELCEISNAFIEG